MLNPRKISLDYMTFFSIYSKETYRDFSDKKIQKIHENRLNQNNTEQNSIFMSFDRFVTSTPREFSMSAVPANQRRLSVAPNVRNMPSPNMSNFKLPANVSLKKASQPIGASGGQIKTRPDMAPLQIPKSEFSV